MDEDEWKGGLALLQMYACGSRGIGYINAGDLGEPEKTTGG